MKRSLIALAFALSAASCNQATPSLEASVGAHGAKVDAKLAQVESIARTLSTLGPTTTDGVALGPAPLVLLKQTGLLYPAANATFAYVEDLRDLSTVGAVRHRIPGSTLANDCAALLRSQKSFAPDPSSDVPSRREPPAATGAAAEILLPRCAQLAYLLVIRTTRKVDPKVHVEDKTYEAGQMDGDVTVFDVGRAKPIGGFHFHATSDDKVRAGGDPNSAAWIDANFTSAIARAIAAGLMAVVPTARLD